MGTCNKVDICFCLWKEFCICLDSCENQQFLRISSIVGLGEIKHGAQVTFKDYRSKLEQVSLMFRIMP
nr:hypothetical protein CFP56_05973 [Quercus suber]